MTRIALMVTGAGLSLAALLAIPVGAAPNLYWIPGAVLAVYGWSRA